jgi:hypothetical protein
MFSETGATRALNWIDEVATKLLPQATRYFLSERSISWKRSESQAVKEFLCDRVVYRESICALGRSAWNHRRHYLAVDSTHRIISNLSNFLQMKWKRWFQGTHRSRVVMLLYTLCFCRFLTTLLVVNQQGFSPLDQVTVKSLLRCGYQRKVRTVCFGTILCHIERVSLRIIGQV